jgi:hypothetical protein
MHTAVQKCQLLFSQRCAILNKMAKRKNPAAVALGRKGGKNSRMNLTPEQRTKLAQKAAAARWKDKPAKGK